MFIVQLKLNIFCFTVVLEFLLKRYLRDEIYESSICMG